MIQDPKTAYPLCWPAGWKRCTNRTRAKFGKSERSIHGNWRTRADLTIDQATRRVLDELERMGIRQHKVIISTDLQLRNDGLPRSGQRAPNDPGAAVYWDAKGGQRCIAVDRYDRIADNLAAIAATLDAMRAIERHGGAEILDRAFTGFTALPAPTAAGEHWRSVLNAHDATSLADVEAIYRRRRSDAHPDRNGGSAVEFDRVQKAWEQAQTEFRA
ncbi:MAG: hypothetical protein Q8Q73_19075 [Stagnimonas sp.]|nr:hypothetical protein [Stagnimonas sp.]